MTRQIQRPTITSAHAAVSYCCPTGEQQAVRMGVTENTWRQYPGREEKPKGSVASHTVEGDFLQADAVLLGGVRHSKAVDSW